MIYTLTLNPSLDYIMEVPELKEGTVNRSTNEKIRFGGKGINVSVVLKNLDIESTALGFTGGFTGEHLENLLYVMGVNCDFIKAEEGFTRINVKLKGKAETEVNGRGPELDENARAKLFEKLSKLKNGDILVLAGSAHGLIYKEIMESLKNKKIDFVVDATGELLTSTLKLRPLLIKPNNFELEEIFGKKLCSIEEITECAKKLQYMGARNVLVSLGAGGGVLICETGKVIVCPAPDGKVINTTGAGDSAVAGFLCAYTQGAGLEETLKLSVAAGSATAFSATLATGEEIRRIYEQMELNEK